jgi:chemotaxis protein MotB
LLKDKITSLKNDSIQNGNAIFVLQNKQDRLNTAYDLLVSQNSRQMSEKAKETKLLLEQLEESQTKLLKKEDDLNKLSATLSEKENELNNAQRILEERSARVNELEKIINQKDSLVTAIKNKVQKALTGLEGDGLTIEQRNGKIYISLEEDLLFASGKYVINQTGVAALNKLSGALASQKDIEILVEGHTDNVKGSGRGSIKDNWDLSVMRATSVVKTLLNNKGLDPLQLTAAGRGEHNPIATNETKEGRKINRRIELILSPNLDDLYDILEE